MLPVVGMSFEDRVELRQHIDEVRRGRLKKAGVRIGHSAEADPAGEQWCADEDCTKKPMRGYVFCPRHAELRHEQLERDTAA